MHDTSPVQMYLGTVLTMAFSVNLGFHLDMNSILVHRKHNF